MEEEEAIKRITRLLEMGGTMLATHHDCGAPLFRYRGEVVCPVCSFEEAIVPQVPSHAEDSKVQSEVRSSSKSRPTSTAGEEVVSATVPEEGEGAEPILPVETRYKGTIAHREAVSGKMDPENEEDLAKEELQRAILQKIGEISEKMRDEQDLSRLKSQLEYVKEALKVLGRLKD